MVENNLDAIEKHLNKFMQEEFSVDPDSIRRDVSLIDEGWLDSYSVVRLVMFIEDSFGIEVSLEEISSTTLHSLESIARFIRSKQIEDGGAAVAKVSM